MAHRLPPRAFAPLALPVALVGASLLAACGASLGASGGSAKAQCPGSQTACLTAPQCAWDEPRACEMCRCSPADAPPDYTPQGPPRMQ